MVSLSLRLNVNAIHFAILWYVGNLANMMFPYVSICFETCGMSPGSFEGCEDMWGTLPYLVAPWRQGAHRLSAGPGSVAQHTAICCEPRAVGYHFGQAMAMGCYGQSTADAKEMCNWETSWDWKSQRGLSKQHETTTSLYISLHLFLSLSLSLSSCFSLFFDFGFLNVSEQSSLKVDKFDGVSRVFMWSWSALCSAGSCSQERQHMYLESSRVVLKA